MILLSQEQVNVREVELPEKCKTLNGFEFNPRLDNWKIKDSSGIEYFNFARLRQYCTDDFIYSYKKVCMWYLENMSASHPRNMYERLSDFIINFIGEGEKIHSISSHHLISYKGYLDDNHEWYLATLAVFLRKWHALGEFGVDSDVISLLRLMKNRGNRKGYAVLTMDPLEGPFTELELQAIHNTINTEFSAARIGIREFALVWLFMATGARPVQIADLKVGDVHFESGGCWVDVPRAKQRSLPRRSAFKARPLVKEVGDVLEAWIKLIKERFESYYQRTGVEPSALPLFPNWKSPNSIRNFEYHSDSDMLSGQVSYLFKKVKIHSHRTKEPMRITPQRFRYTLGTRAAMEKQGPLVIAELLDHTDTQNVIVYTKATPEIVRILDRALATEMGALAKAFAGEIVLEDFDTGRLDDKQQVRVPRKKPAEGGVGRCANCVGCENRNPYGCYVCTQFRAWLYGPHEEVLKDLLDDRKRKLDETGDETIAFTNDHLILAVAQVCDMCKEMKLEKEGKYDRK